MACSQLSKFHRSVSAVFHRSPLIASNKRRLPYATSARRRRVVAGERGAALSSIAVAYLLLLSHRVRDSLPCCVPRRVGHTTRPTTRTRQAPAGRLAGSTGRIKGWKTYCCGRALKVIAFATGFCASSERAVRASGRDHTGFVASPLAAAGHTALAAGRFLDSRTAFGGKFCLERVDLPAGSI